MNPAALPLFQQLAKQVNRLQGGKTPRRRLGLDLGSQSIKLVELEQTASGPRLVKVLIQELPAAESGQPVDLVGWPHHLSAAQGAGRESGSPSANSQVVGWLQTALKEFTIGDVHLSVSGPQVAVRRLHVPQMSKQELPEAVKWEVREHVSFPIQEAVVDFRIVGDVWEKDVKKQDVLAAAAARPMIDELLKTVERAGARAASLAPTHLAMWRCVSTLIPETTQGSVAVIELGASQTQVTIAKDGHVRLVRDLHIGSASLTEALIGVVASDEGAEITIDRSKAEALKRRYGVLSDATEGNTEEGLPLFHLSSLMRPVLEGLLTELSRLFDSYKVQMEEGGVTRVLLCGAGANLKQLQPFLANGLGMTVEIFNPLVRITDRLQPMEPEQIADTGPRLAVAIGLALDHGNGLNVLPVELKQARASAAARRVWVQVATSLGAGAVALYIGLHLVAFALGHRLRSQQQEWARLDPAYSTYMEAAAHQRMFESSIAQVRAFLDRQPLWEGMFKEISTLVPSTIELDELTVEPGGTMGSAPWHVHVQGRLAAGESARGGGMAQFLETLERSVFFREVELTSSEMHSSDTGTSRFILDGQLE